MTPSLLHDGTTIAQQYLQQATALQQELQVAIDAIARNSLSEFEQSLWQQEMLSTGMRRCLVLLRNLHVDQTLLRKLRAANASLQQVSRTYHGLIGQSSQSATVLRGLCTLYEVPSSTSSKAHALYYEA